MLAAITQHLQLAGLVPIAVGAQTAHNLVHRFSRRLVLVEKIAGQEDHVYITFLCRAHDFVESLPTVISADWISFAIADMVVCCDQDTYSIIGCELSVIKALEMRTRRLTRCCRHDEATSSTRR